MRDDCALIKFVPGPDPRIVFPVDATFGMTTLRQTSVARGGSGKSGVRVGDGVGVGNRVMGDVSVLMLLLENRGGSDEAAVLSEADEVELITLEESEEDNDGVGML